MWFSNLQIAKVKIFQKTILNLKFKFPANNTSGDLEIWKTNQTFWKKNTFNSSIQVCFNCKKELYGFFLWYLEPIGGSKPQLSEDSSFKRILRSKEDSMALLCPAQGYPTPAFRLTFWKNKLLISQDPKNVTP